MFVSVSDVAYHVAVKTGDIPGGSSDSNVFVKLYGEKGDTSKMLLVVSANNLGNYFETGRVDIFTVETFDIGQVTQRRQQHVLMSSFRCWKCLDDKLGNHFFKDFRVHSRFIHTDDMTWLVQSFIFQKGSRDDHNFVRGYPEFVTSLLRYGFHCD